MVPTVVGVSSAAVARIGPVGCGVLVVFRMGFGFGASLAFIRTPPSWKVMEVRRFLKFARRGIGLACDFGLAGWPKAMDSMVWALGFQR